MFQLGLLVFLLLQTSCFCATYKDVSGLDSSEEITQPTSVSQNKRIEAMEKEIEALKSLVQRNCHATEAQNLLKRKRAVSQIAFSAWLGNPQAHVGIGHTLKFDRVIINDGNAYNHITGIFTAPQSGVYAFHFWIHTYRIHQLAVKIMVNGNNEVDGIAEGVPSGDDIQGGNSQIVRLYEGNTVWLEAFLTADSYIFVSNSERYSSFSGHFLY